MESCEQFILQNKLFERGDVVGVGCSGGSDSLALLHYLANNQSRFDIEVVAVYVDHQIRENSEEDGEFVRQKAREFGVRFYKFKIDVPRLAKEKNQSLETAGREGRRGVFKALVDKGVVDKIALAHHQQDQVETILMHLFRGSGLAGMRGMEAKTSFYVRPLLSTKKEEILEYLSLNQLEYLEDYTNAENNYNRNFLRNVVLKDIRSRWPGVDDAIIKFSENIKEDDDFINSQVSMDTVILDSKMVKIPLSYFMYSSALTSRMIFQALKKLGITHDIERKHIDLILDLAQNGYNGNRMSLPFGAVAVKEYDYLTITCAGEKIEPEEFVKPFKCGDVQVPNFGKICVKKMKDFDLVDTWVAEDGVLFIDVKKLPKDAVWRYRQEGDNFTKYGGGSKKLKSYLIDKKVPARLRNFIPVLASGKEVYVIAGLEVSDKVKVERGSTIYQISTKNAPKLV